VQKRVRHDFTRAGKVLLVASLLLVFVAGFLDLPEVGRRVSPERFWGLNVLRMEWQLAKANMHLARAEATLRALRLAAERGFPHFEDVPKPGLAGLQSAVQRMEADRLYRKAVEEEIADYLQRYRRNADAAKKRGGS
jgi:hypothetical protein